MLGDGRCEGTGDTVKGCGCEKGSDVAKKKKRKEDRKSAKEMILNRRREWAIAIVGENLSKTAKEKKIYETLSAGSASRIIT